MKKLLTILAAVGLTATTGATVVACGNKNQKEKPADKLKMGIDNSDITISGDGYVIREITNFNELKNVKVELTIADFAKENVQVELENIQPYDGIKQIGSLKVTTIKSDTLMETVQGTIKLTADGIDETLITLKLIKSEKEIITDKDEYTTTVGVTTTILIDNLYTQAPHSVIGDRNIISEKTTVNDEGKWIIEVTGQRVGETTLTIKANGFVEKTVKITVAEGIKTDKSKYTVKVGKTTTILVSNLGLHISHPVISNRNAISEKTTTNDEGKWIIEVTGQNVGYTTLTIRAYGFADKTVKIDVTK
jgi:hypothetical protein